MVEMVEGFVTGTVNWRVKGGKVVALTSLLLIPNTFLEDEWVGSCSFVSMCPCIDMVCLLLTFCLSMLSCDVLTLFARLSRLLGWLLLMSAA